MTDVQETNGSLDSMVMFGSYVLIEKDKPQERRSPGGIVLPMQSSVEPSWATVRLVGEDASGRLHAEDRVIVSRFAGADVKIGGEQYFVVHMDDIYGVSRTAS